MSEIDIMDFSFVWNKWIVPLINKIPEQMDADFKQRAKFSVRDLERLEYLASKYYIEKREAIKREYYGEDAKDVSKKHLMDFHKLSAVLCRTLIEYKVYDFDTSVCNQYIAEEKIDSKDTDWLVHNVLVNFRLAFYASVVFLYQSMLFNFQRETPELYELLRKQKGLNLYVKKRNGNVHESFENSLVLDLAKRDINNRSFDCFLYSAIMYQLEEYNRMLLEQQLYNQKDYVTVRNCCKFEKSSFNGSFFTILIKILIII